MLGEMSIAMCAWRRPSRQACGLRRTNLCWVVITLRVTPHRCFTVRSPGLGQRELAKAKICRRSGSGGA